MSYLMISKELLDSSFWGNLALEERAIITELMHRTSYKPCSYSLRGKEIKLRAFEFCFFASSFAKGMKVKLHSFRRLLDKMCASDLIRKEKKSFSSECNQLPNQLSNQFKGYTNTCNYTSITFYPWAFAQGDKPQKREAETLQSDISSETGDATLYIDKEEEEFNKGRGHNFMEYKNPMIRFADNPQLKELIPEQSLAYFVLTYECRMEDLENLFRYFIARQQSEGMEFLMHKELQRRFAYFLKEEYNRKMQHERSAASNKNFKSRQTTNNYGKSESVQPEVKREKSESEKRREADDAAIIARMPRFGGSSAGLDAVRKRKRRYGTRGTE